jgi:hypothetical protein
MAGNTGTPSALGCVYGKTLPDLGGRSWHDDLFDREFGFLVKYRRNRVTDTRFQGKHSIHMAGNLNDG